VTLTFDCKIKRSTKFSDRFCWNPWICFWDIFIYMFDLELVTFTFDRNIKYSTKYRPCNSMRTCEIWFKSIEQFLRYLHLYIPPWILVTLTFDLKFKKIIISRPCKNLPTAKVSPKSYEYFLSNFANRQPFGHNKRGPKILGIRPPPFWGRGNGIPI